MMNKDQKQSAEDGSMAIQAGGNLTIVKNGPTYSEVRDIAQDIFQANSLKLADIAENIVNERIAEIIEKILSKFQLENPEGLLMARDPDFQYALFTVQKEYARTGDENLGDLLVDLLIDRSKQKHRDILQIVLNESLKTAPKLTENQLAILAVTFLFKYTLHHRIQNHVDFGLYLDRHVAPFIPMILKNIASYQHLEYSGCGTIGIAENKLEKILGTHYQGLFMKGFSREIITNRNISIGMDERIFIPCLNNPSNVQVLMMREELLEKAFDMYNISKFDRPKINDQFKYNKMNESEIKEKCIEIRPYMAKLFDVWSNSAMKKFTLTSVGIAIAHANIKRLTGEFTDLSTWIN